MPREAAGIVHRNRHAPARSDMSIHVGVDVELRRILGDGAKWRDPHAQHSRGPTDLGQVVGRFLHRAVHKAVHPDVAYHGQQWLVHRSRSGRAGAASSSRARRPSGIALHGIAPQPTQRPALLLPARSAVGCNFLFGGPSANRRHYRHLRLEWYAHRRIGSCDRE